MESDALTYISKINGNAESDDKPIKVDGQRAVIFEVVRILGRIEAFSSFFAKSLGTNFEDNGLRYASVSAARDSQ